MDLNECIDLQRGPRMNLIEWLQRRFLLADPLRCAQCNVDMVLIQRNGNHVDGCHWYVQLSRKAKFGPGCISIVGSLQLKFKFLLNGVLAYWRVAACTLIL